MFAHLERFLSYVDAGGGFVMLPLTGATLVLWYALGYRLLTLRRGSNKRLAALVADYRVGRGGRPRGVLDGAIDRCLEVLGRRPPNPHRALDDVLFDHRCELGRYATLADVVVIVAPLAGLLGTVAGMIETFDALGDMSLFSQSGGIAGGVSQALITTQMGLAVAIPGLLVGRILRRRQHKLDDELTQLRDLLCAQAAEGGSSTALGLHAQ